MLFPPSLHFTSKDVFPDASSFFCSYRPLIPNHFFCRATNPPERGCGQCWAACKKIGLHVKFPEKVPLAKYVVTQILVPPPFPSKYWSCRNGTPRHSRHDRGSVVTRRMFDCGCFSVPFYFAGLSVLTCSNFVTSGTRTAEAIDEAIVRVRRARSMTIPVNRHVDLITLLIVADGNCLETSLTVTNVIQVSLDANIVVSTCRWVETPVDGFKTSVTTWRPVHREARETLAGHIFPYEGTRPGSTIVPFFQLLGGATQTMAVQLKHWSHSERHQVYDPCCTCTALTPCSAPHNLRNLGCLRKPPFVERHN